MREKNDDDHGAGLIHQTIPDVDDTEPRLTIQLPDDVSAKMRDNAAFVLRRQQANKLRAVAEWFRDCKTLTLENMPHGLIAALEAGAATLRAEERDMAGLIDVLQVAFRDASNRHCSADYLEGMNEAITLVESHLREAQ